MNTSTGSWHQLFRSNTLLIAIVPAMTLLGLAVVFSRVFFDVAYDLTKSNSRTTPHTTRVASSAGVRDRNTSSVLKSPFGVVEGSLQSPASTVQSAAEEISPELVDAAKAEYQRTHSHVVTYRQVIDPETGALKKEEWQDASGAFHRDGGPAVVGYRSDGSASYRRYYQKGVQHRADGSADTGRRSDGSIVSETYYVNGRLHRVDGPAVIRRRSNGSVSYEAFYIDNVIHRTDGPAVIGRRSDNSVSYEAHYTDGVLHRADGPAAIWYGPGGEITQVLDISKGVEKYSNF